MRAKRPGDSGESPSRGVRLCCGKTRNKLLPLSLWWRSSVGFLIARRDCVVLRRRRSFSPNCDAYPKFRSNHPAPAEKNSAEFATNFLPSFLVRSTKNMRLNEGDGVSARGPRLASNRSSRISAFTDLSHSFSVFVAVCSAPLRAKGRRVDRDATNRPANIKDAGIDA